MRSLLRGATVRAKLIWMALATTLTALLLCAGAMLFYDLSTFQQSWKDDLSSQADILSLASAAAINFNDAAAANQNLGMLTARPQILAAAIYTADGRLFATYAQAAQAAPGTPPAFPARPGPAGHRIDGDRMELFRPIRDHNEIIGTVYLEARYLVGERLLSYATILGGVMLCSLLVAALVATQLQRAITEPLAAVTAVARKVIDQRDFNLRVTKSTSGEIGTLIAAFNAMLAEIGRRADDLQAANRSLEREMGVRQDAESALLLADRRKDEFLATLAHELRNPLAPIRTGLDILRVNPGDLVGAERARAIMERQLRQMVRLVDDLLDVSRINTGKLAVNIEATELQTVIDDALEIVRPLYELKKHVLTVNPLPRPVVLNGDATRLTQILSNLLNNAARYTAHGGQIALEVEVQERWVLVYLRDNGTGIAPDMHEAIFQMFVQADTSLERVNAGLGVGLSLARRLAELHGGTLSVHSLGVGYGSEFVLRLPIPAQQRARHVARATGAAPQAGLRVLLADDNVDFVGSMGALLQAKGHAVLVAHDGLQALAAAPAFAPHFAFLDIGMPGMNGYDLARALRAMPQMDATRLVAVTGWGQQKDRELAAAAGFDTLLIKPVSFEQLEALMRNGPA